MMDVDGAHFRRQLLPILKHIANASFITFDLEMSGISTRSNSKASTDRSQDVGKPSLQSLYDEMRNAAETFQVLQVGITCVEEDREREFYLARPFNFNLSPLAAEGVDLRQDRHFTFSSSACDFLQKNAFDFGKVFTSGVPYLSRSEEDELREEFKNRLSKISTIPDVVIPPSDSLTLEFYRSARRTISEWVNPPTKSEKQDDFVNIVRKNGLNGYQRRLIHQLVRSEFPTLKAFAKCDGEFMRVEKLDPKREADFQARKLNVFNNLIAKQKGLSWVFEALCNGDLTGIQAEWFASPEISEKDMTALKLELASITEKLRSKRHTIVGHNLFMDLAYLYNTFIGPLPGKVKHFQEDIHELFPVVIDTKYLATYGDSAMGPRNSLKELLAPFLKVHIPLIVLCEGHTKYGAAFGKEHEAGFDSWMTAELFVKLTAKLYASSHISSPSTSSTTTKPLRTPDSEDAITFSSDEDDDEDSSASGGGVRLTPSLGSHSTSPNVNVLDKHLPPSWHAMMLQNPFAVLADKGNGDRDGDGDGDGDKITRTGQWVPAIGNRFWGPYINKLRVNAIDGGVCDLAAEEKGDE